jgi:hypothetical protein
MMTFPYMAIWKIKAMFQTTNQIKPHGKSQKKSGILRCTSVANFSATFCSSPVRWALSMATLKRSWKGSVLTGFSHDLSGWWFFNHLEKYDFVNGKDDNPYKKWKIKFMFETTNQFMDLV